MSVSHVTRTLSRFENSAGIRIGETMSILSILNYVCKLVFVAALTAFPLTSFRGGKHLHVESGRKNINGTELYYKIIGEGEPIVILHGGPGLDHSYFLPQMEKLADNFQLIFFDQRASGRSSVDVDTSSMTLNQFIEDIESLRTEFKLDKMNLMGHSWGGLLAMEYAIKYPHHLNSLMLVNPTAASSAFQDQAFQTMAARTTRQDSMDNARIMQTAAFKNREPEAMSDFFRVLFRGSFFDRRLADSLTLSFDPNYAAHSRTMNYLYKDTSLLNYDIHSKLSVISCPTLIVHGDHDFLPLEAAQAIRDHISGSQLVVLPNCGHFSFIESPDKLLDAVSGLLRAH
jgi:proline iminopeptidase